MKPWCIFLFILSAGCLLSACTPLEEPLPPVQTTPSLEVDRYMGRWYEIAGVSLPFQKDCYCTQSTYTRNKKDSQQIQTSSLCMKNSPSGKLSIIKPGVWIVPNTGNAKIKIQFIWPFKYDYWILYVDENYQYTVAGTPDRQYFWILAREPQIPFAVYQDLLQRAEDQGYSTQYLTLTKQCRHGHEIKSVM